MKDKIIFAVRAAQRDELFQSTVAKTIVVLEASQELNDKFARLTKRNQLDPYKVMRKLVSIYLAVRKSSSENPYKGLRALLRVWVSRTRSGNLSGFESCGWSA